MNLINLNKKLDKRQKLYDNLMHSIYFNKLWGGNNNETLIAGCYSVNKKFRLSLPKIVYITIRNESKMIGFKVKYQIFKQLPIKNVKINLLNYHPKMVQENNLQFTEITLDK
jgi:hypothetical protein